MVVDTRDKAAPNSSTAQTRLALAWARLYRTPLALAALIGVVALLPRIIGLADFVTTDEAYHWIGRVERFSAAIQARRWAETAQTGHPGVTLMWLGSLGLALERAATAWGWQSGASGVAHLAWLRAAPVLLEALLIPAGYLVLRRLVAPATALVAALLWATSPYMIAHARLLHLDALLTAFVTLSVLLLLAATEQRTKNREQRRPTEPFVLCSLFFVLGSGVCAGLALLTKGPALILLPFAGLLLFWRAPAAGFVARLRWAIGWYAAWLGLALLVVALLWPALWVDAPGALALYRDEIVGNGGRPNGDGQFFLGQAIRDPGPLFYIVADVLRTTPATLLGLLALPLALRRSTTDGLTEDRGWRIEDGEGRSSILYPLSSIFYRLFSMVVGRRSSERRVLLALAAFVLFWTLVMTLGPKKFDRYVLPTWPALCVLAAMGLVALFKVGTLERWNVRAGLVALLALVELAQPALVHPYYLSYYNPLLGGGATAQRALLIGWGEGMDQVGGYLRGRPDIEEGQVLSALGQTLQPFVPVPVRDVTTLADSPPANYAVVYLESSQRGANPAIYATIRQTVPLHRVTIHGIDYAEIYQLPKPFDTPIGARFGAALDLRGVTVRQSPGQVVVTPAWDVRGPLAGDYLLFLHLIDSQGQRVAQADVAPGGSSAPPTSAWQPGQQLAVPIDLRPPASLPPGEYRLVLGLYDQASGARLPFAGGTPEDPAVDGPDALRVATLTIH